MHEPSTNILEGKTVIEDFYSSYLSTWLEKNMSSTAGDDYLLSIAVLLCAELDPNLCPVMLQYIVEAYTKTEI